MAAIGQHVRLLAGELNPKSLHLHKESTSNNVIITTGGRHISVYSVGDSQPLYSWTIMSGLTLTSGAVYDSKSQRYAAVINNKLIRLWTKNEMAINKSKKITMTKAVHSLVTRGQYEPVILYEDGSLAWLSTPTELIAMPHLKHAERITAADAVLHNDNLVLFVLCHNEKSEVSGFVYEISQDAQSVAAKSIDITGDESTMCSQCLRVRDGQVTHLFLDRSGHLSETYLTGPSVGNVVSNHTIPLHPTLSRAAICSLGSTHLAVYGVLSPNSPQPCIGIWDTKFGILQASRPLPFTAQREDSVQVHEHAGQIALVCRQGLFLFSCTSSQSTLGAAFGKFRASLYDPQQSQEDEITGLLRKLASQEQIKTQKAFTETFKELVEIISGRDETPDMLQLQNLLTAVLKRCLTEKKFWPRDEIELMVQHSMIPTSLITELAEALTSHRELNLLLTCLKTLPDVPEPAIRIALTFALGLGKTEFLSDIQREKIKNKKKTMREDKGQSADYPFDKKKARFITQIMRSPFNDVFMASEVRKMDFHQCLQLLLYLHDLLLVEEKRTQVPLIKIVDWLNLILDAHFTQLVLSSDAHPVLVKLHQVVAEQVQFYNELVSLESILAQIKEKCKLPNRQFPGRYNIHTLHVY